LTSVIILDLENEIGKITTCVGVVFAINFLHWKLQIAVKKLKAMNSKAEMEFAVEVEVLGRVRHKNLLGLRGYCVGDDQRLIVYDYMPNLSLLSHLHGQYAGEVQLNWQKRMSIAIGSAEGIL